MSCQVQQVGNVYCFKLIELFLFIAYYSTCRYDINTDLHCESKTLHHTFIRNFYDESLIEQNCYTQTTIRFQRQVAFYAITAQQFSDPLLSGKKTIKQCVVK